MSRSLAGRVALLEQLTVIGAIAAFGLLSLWVTAQVLRRERMAFVTTTAQRLAATFVEDLEEDPDTLVVAKGLIEDAREVGVQVEVRDGRGHLLASSFPPREAASSAATGSRKDEDESSLTATARNALGARIDARVNEQARQANLSALARSLLIAALPILALSLIIGRWMVTRALRPLSIMAERAEGLAVQHKPRSLGGRSGLVEVDRLAASFDRLLVRLDATMSSERRLTADASHELRTPLTALSGELELLAERTPADSPAADGVRRCSRQVAAMRELVEAILLLHRSSETGVQQDSAFELLNLGDMVRETTAELVLLYPERRPDLTLEAPDEVLVKGHGALLASALANLIDNALKFTHAGEQVSIHLFEEVDRARLVVEDQGPGIPEGERERIFDPFFRGALASMAPRGAGLGLPILRRVARAHGGDVEVSASESGGARMVLILPTSGPEGRGGTAQANS